MCLNLQILIQQLFVVHVAAPYDPEDSWQSVQLHYLLSNIFSMWLKPTNPCILTLDNEQQKKQRNNSTNTHHLFMHIVNFYQYKQNKDTTGASYERSFFQVQVDKILKKDNNQQSILDDKVVLVFILNKVCECVLLDQILK